MQPQRQPLPIIRLAVIAILFIVLILVLTLHIGIPNKTITIDASPAAATTKNTVSYSGLDDLVDAGLTTTQVDDFKYAIYAYTSQNNFEGKLFVTLTDINHERDFANNIDNYTAIMTINNQTMTIVISSSDLESITTSFKDDSNNVIYQSGTINTTTDASGDSN